MSTITALPEGLSGAGLICWWELSGRVDPDALAESLADEGLPIRPPVTTPRVALSQAVARLAGARAARASGVVALKRDGLSFFLVERHLVDGGADVSLAAFARVEVDALGEFQAVILRPGPVDLAEDIIGLAKTLLTTAATQSLSSWICAAHTRLFKAVSLRSTGGFYYVPPASRPVFDAFWRALKVVSSHSVSTIDALPSIETVAAVGAALRREYATAIAELETDLNEAGADGISKRSKRIKIERCETLREKLAAYTGLLGTSLADLDDAVASLGAALALVPEEA
jgi:hypothetical protein